MSLLGDMKMKQVDKAELVWKSLADSTRREILDVLVEGPRTTGDIVAEFDHLCRTNVMKHLDMLVKSDLVLVRREGRVRWNHLNAVPIQQICDRWVKKHIQGLAAAMTRLKKHVETDSLPAGTKKESAKIKPGQARIKVRTKR